MTAATNPQVTRNDLIFKGLNDPQRKGVETLDGPVLILAGAGSGKTRVLTHRMANLMASGKASPDEILAVTFTNKAAREMESRIFALLSEIGYSVREPLWVSTFHSFCSRILRNTADLLDYKPGFSIYDDGDQLAQIKKVMTALNISEKVHPPKNFRNRINSAKMLALGPDQVSRSKGLLMDEKSIEVYRVYEEQMKKANAMDFGDLLLKVYELYEMYPNLLEEHQQKFRYILVDEYQDTNQIQYLLVKKLSSSHRNLCVVGDEDQSIYSWRGADISNILNFEKDFPEAVVIKLEENYRSTETIVNAASKLIRNNSQRKDKTLFTRQPTGDPIRVFEASNEYDEARWVVRTMQEIVNEGEFNWSDFAVFYRTNAQSRVFEEQLRLNSIPYQIVGGLRFFERAEIKDILSYLKLALNPADDMAMKRIFNVPTRGLGKTTLESLEEKSFQQKINLKTACEMAVQEKWFHTGTTHKLRDFVSLLDDLREQSQKLDLLEFYQYALEKIGYVMKLRLEDSAEADARIQNLEELSNVISQFMKERSEANLQSFLEEMALVSDADSIEERNSQVTLMTLHVSKGLEFPVVFVVGMEENLFPSAQGFDESGEDSLEEERRLAYVGMTRARKKLHLSYAVTRKVWGQDQSNPPSRFLSEIPQEHLQFQSGAQRPSFVQRWGGHATKTASDSVRVRKKSDDFETQAFADETSELTTYEKGMRVRHPSFGVGSIFQVEGSGDAMKVSVLFSDQTIKKFVAKYARLERI